jgi:hypothetical protein
VVLSIGSRYARQHLVSALKEHSEGQLHHQNFGIAHLHPGRFSNYSLIVYLGDDVSAQTSETVSV